jgi:hypothetical protein
VQKRGRMRTFLTFCGCLASLTLAHTQGTPASAPTWAEVVAVIERLNASNTLRDVEQVLRVNSALVTNPAADALFASTLQNPQLTAPQRVIVTVSQETFRDARAGGIELAAETLGVRVTILELTGAQTEADARAVLVKRRDVTSSPQLAAAFSRVAAQPDVDAAVIREIAAAFQEANQSPDTAVARLRRLAGGAAAPATGTAAPAGGSATGVSSPLAGHWRCTTTVGAGDASITTDHHMVLNADGTFRSWQTSFNSFSGRESNTTPETGRWSVRGSTLVLTGANGQPVDVPFQRSGDTILLPNESSRRLWERVR